MSRGYRTYVRTKSCVRVISGTVAVTRVSTSNHQFSSLPAIYEVSRMVDLMVELAMHFATPLGLLPKDL